MLKLACSFIFWLRLVIAFNRSDMVLPLALGILALFYVLPRLAAKAWAIFARKRLARDAERENLARANSEEYSFSTSVRRELERQRALDDQQLAAMAATLNLQAVADERKARMLDESLRAAAVRRGADIAILLERLDTLKSEAEK